MSDRPRGRRRASMAPSSNTTNAASPLSPPYFPARSSEGILSRPPDPQDIVVRGPRTHGLEKYPRHVPNPDRDEKRRLEVFSNKENKHLEMEITVVSDIDECWMFKDVVERLKLNIKSDLIGTPKFGYLGQQMFEFGGTVTLQWIWKDKSESRKCRVIPRFGFEIYIPSSILPPRSPKQSGPVIHNSISSPPPPDSTPSSPSSSATRTSTEFSGAFDGDGLPEFPDTSEKAIWADDWMKVLKQMQEKRRQNQWLPGPGQNKERPRIKIAVLDTGVDTSHNFIKGAKKRIIVFPSYVKDDNSTQDTYGHGTHVAKLLLTVAPEAQLFVFKIAKGSQIPANHQIADAITLAIDLSVDIITMSFGIDKDHPEMEEAILAAYGKGIIMFAAASNKGHNHPVPFPARSSNVLCIYATDGKGNNYDCNPKCLKKSGYHFATLGVAVKSAWIENPDQHLEESEESASRRMSGTSFATPIVAGIAAYILDFARMHGLDDASYRKLRSREGMEELLGKWFVDEVGELDYVYPWKLFEDHRKEELILQLIKDTFAGSIGEPRTPEIV